jgi:hypothetical protein
MDLARPNVEYELADGDAACRAQVHARVALDDPVGVGGIRSISTWALASGVRQAMLGSEGNESRWESYSDSEFALEGVPFGVTLSRASKLHRIRLAGIS